MFVDWMQSWPDWLQGAWFAYVTFHDLIQWGIMVIIGWTAWGQRKHERELQLLIEKLSAELRHVHEEVHNHIDEDAQLHRNLGQFGISRGELRGQLRIGV